TERLKKLESEQITDGQRKIQEIKIELETEERPFIELGIKQKITEITEELEGTEIDNLNHYLTYKLIDGRTLEVEGKQYTLTVNLLIIAETTTYHISVQAKDEGNNEDNRK
ncbi:MAG: hypothetical protein GX764_03880, partial [Firmicutes bacterium]|nr:hypothetical protein [Bacillota bacterium]